MIQVLITRDDFHCRKEELGEVVNNFLANDELWADTGWRSLEVAYLAFPNEKFREITINS